MDFIFFNCRWAWKSIWDRSIFVDEGVWIHSRLVACTFAQLLICIILIAFWVIIFREALNETLASESVYVWE